jgi:hypothetical protein
VPLAEKYDINRPQTQVESDIPFSETFVSSGGDADGVREYLVGDRLNNIHWKLSAANVNDDIYVREFSDSMSDVVIVLFEYFKGNTDAVIDGVFKACRSLISGGIPFTLMWVNGGCEDPVIKQITTNDDFDAAVEELYVSYPCENATAAIDYFTKITGSQNCIYINGNDAEINF